MIEEIGKQIAIFLTAFALSAIVAFIGGIVGYRMGFHHGFTRGLSEISKQTTDSLRLIIDEAKRRENASNDSGDQ